MNPIVRYHHLSLSVTDLDRSAAWYRDVLGLEQTAEVEGAGFRRRRFQAPAGDGGGAHPVTLTLTRHDDAGGAFDERRTGMDHLSFQVGGLDDLVALKGRLEQHGVIHSELRRMDSGAGMITFRDPDNIQLEAFAPPAGS